MARIDIHRPAAIIPSDYVYVGIEYLKIEDIGSCAELQYWRGVIKEHMALTGGTYASHEHGGSCMACGASAIYTVLFHHIPTNTYVRTGQDCAEKLDLAANFGDLDAFRDAIKDARELKAGKRKAETTLADLDLTAAWVLYNSPIPACTCTWSKPDINGTLKYNTGYIYPDEPCSCHREGKEEDIVRDIVGKLVKYGSISEAQVRLIRFQLDRIANRAEYEAKRAAEKAVAAPSPAGRVTVSGVVLKEELRDSDFGTQHKMFFKADEGFTVWASVPGLAKYPEAASIVRGTRLSMKITLVPARDDPKHSFGSRPVLIAEPQAPVLEAVAS